MDKNIIFELALVSKPSRSLRPTAVTAVTEVNAVDSANSNSYGTFPNGFMHSLYKLITDARTFTSYPVYQ